MKKILSVMLAIMMLFGALSVSASATNVSEIQQYKNTFFVEDGVQLNDRVIIVFRFNGGSSRDALPVYTPDGQTKFTATDGVSGTYYLLPGANGNYLTNDSIVQMPYVVPNDSTTQSFNGWRCSLDGKSYGAGSYFLVTDEVIKQAHASMTGGIIYMDAEYYTLEGEGDTLQAVLGVLMKVFGTIIGILFLDGQSSAGIELMEKVLGGLL